MRPDAFAWLAGPGLYHGGLQLSASEDASILREHQLIPFPQLTDQTPLSMAITEFHFLTLYEDGVRAINRLSGEVAASCPPPREALVKSSTGTVNSTVKGVHILNQSKIQHISFIKYN